MKVLQINNFHYRRGGSDVVYLNTSELLKSKGHQVIQFSQSHPSNLPSENSKYFPPYRDLPNASLLNKFRSVFSFFFSFEAYRKLELLLKKEQPDIAHLHIFYGGLSSSILRALKKKKIPVVVTLHEYKLLCPVYTFLDSQNRVCELCARGKYFHGGLKKCSKNNALFSWVMALESYFRDYFFNPVKYLDKVICVSQFALSKHLQYRPMLSNRLVHLYNFSQSTPREIEKKHEGYFLYFGRLSHEKGIKTLIRVWKAFGNQVLKIAGTGPLMEELQEEITTLKMSNVELLGFQTGNDLKELVSKAFFSVVPSEWYENNPMSIIESYSAGTPVIGASIGGIPEIIIQKTTGFHFESGNANSLESTIKLALALKDDSERYQEFSKSCVKFAKEKFDVDSHYKALVSIYQSSIKKA